MTLDQLRQQAIAASAKDEEYQEKVKTYLKKGQRKGGFLVRWFVAKDGTWLEGSLLKIGQGTSSYRWRLAVCGESHAMAFGQVTNSVEAARGLTKAAKMFVLEEIYAE